MHYVRVTNPRYAQSQRYHGQVGEVVGRWGPENSADSRDGYLVEFDDGEIIGLTEEEVEPAELSRGTETVNGPDEVTARD